MARRAPKSLVLEWDEAGWDQLLTGIVKSHLEPRAEKIADACNKHVEAQANSSLSEQDSSFTDPRKQKARRRGRAIMHQEPADGKRDFMVDSEGSNPLNLNDYRATVITVTNRAKLDNARSHTLVANLHLGAGGVS